MTLADTTRDVDLPGRAGGRWWPAVRLALGLLLSALGVWLVLRGVSLARVAAVLGQARLGLLAAAVAADLVLAAAIAARWQLLFVPPLPARGRLFQILTITQLANAVLPGRPGALVRAYLAGQGRAGGMAESLTTIVGEKVVEGLGLGVVAVALLPFVPLPGWLRLTVAVGAGLLLAVLALFVGLAGHREAAMRGLARLLHRWPWLVARAGQVLDALGAWRQPRTVLALGAWSAAVWGVAAVRCQLVLWCLGIPAPGTASLVILVLSQASSRLPASPAGIGVLHYASVLALSLYGVPADVALGYGVLYHLLIYLPTSLLGLFFLARWGLGLRRLERSSTAGEPER
jgi:hypothetical protein